MEHKPIFTRITLTTTGTSLCLKAFLFAVATAGRPRAAELPVPADFRAANRHRDVTAKQPHVPGKRCMDHGHGSNTRGPDPDLYDTPTGKAKLTY
jgi:hypothetical protein